MTQVTDREVLMELANQPIGNKSLQGNDPKAMCYQPEAIEAARRASKKWLPAGKLATSGKAVREREAAFYERQVDLEDAVAAAGGSRGCLRA